MAKKEVSLFEEESGEPPGCLSGRGLGVPGVPGGADCPGRVSGPVHHHARLGRVAGGSALRRRSGELRPVYLEAVSSGPEGRGAARGRA